MFKMISFIIKTSLTDTSHTHIVLNKEYMVPVVEEVLIRMIWKIGS